MRRLFLILGLSLLAAQCAEPSEPVAPDAEAPVAGPASLFGRIVDDAGNPIQAARVLVADRNSPFAWPLDSPAWIGEGARTEQVLTDADGAFRFEGLRFKSARLSIRAAEFAPLEIRSARLEARRALDLGAIAMPRGAQVRGRLVTDSGSPLAGAGLYFLRPEDSLPHAHAWTGFPVAHTNSRGEFETEPLELGPFILAVDAAGQAPFRLIGSLESNLDLGEHALPKPETISGIVHSFPIGELSDLIVVALPTCAVPFAWRADHERGIPARWLEGFATARFAGSGGFSLSGLLPETPYSLRVLAPGDELRIDDAWSLPRLVQSGTEDLVLSVHPSVRIDFQVVDERTGDPIVEFEHAWIGARALPRNGVEYLRATTPTRRFLLEVKAEGYRDYRSEPLAFVEGNPLTPLRVELSPGSGEAPRAAELPNAERTNPLATLPGFASEPAPSAAPPSSQERGTLAGRVTTRGTPLRGAVLAVYPVREGEAFYSARDRTLGRARTDSLGRFQIRDLPREKLVLSVAHESRALAALRVVNLAGENALHEFELESATLSGRVIRANGTPVAEASIHLPAQWKRDAPLDSRSAIAWSELRTPPVVATTDGDGKFELRGLEHIESLTITAKHETDGVGSLRLANLKEEITILLSSNSTLIVQGFDPKPNERALGLAWRWGQGLEHETRFSLAPEKKHEFDGLSADEWTLFQAELDGWGEISSIRILAPVLLDPVGATTIDLH